MFERFTDRARKVMALANLEAQRFNSEYIGTEHLLLGIVKEGSGMAASVLKSLNINLRTIRLEVGKLVKSGYEVVTTEKLPRTPQAEKVIESTIEESRNFNHNYIGTEHLLLGLLRESDDLAVQVLMNLGVKLEDVREMITDLLDSEKPEDILSAYARGTGGPMGIKVCDVIRYDRVLQPNPAHSMTIFDITDGSEILVQRIILEVDAPSCKSEITFYDIDGNKYKAHFAGFSIGTG